MIREKVSLPFKFKRRLTFEDDCFNIMCCIGKGHMYLVNYIDHGMQLTQYVVFTWFSISIEFKCKSRNVCDKKYKNSKNSCDSNCL